MQQLLKRRTQTWERSSKPAEKKKYPHCGTPILSLGDSGGGGGRASSWYSTQFNQHSEHVCSFPSSVL